MQAKKTQMIRLANILGMDVDKEQHQVALLDSISGVSVVDDFIEYCREKQSSIDYANRLDKLEVLYTRYKNTIDDIPTYTIESYCKNLSSKFKEAIQTLRDHEEHLSADLSKLIVQDTQWFTNKEIDSLMAIGGLRGCINAYELGSLFEKMYEVSVKRYIGFKKQNALSDGQRKVKALIGKDLL